ncbi:nuclear transport factor 2 family protein [Luteimonas sp. RD2P54]|uniref:Nuclear transport factor 2 family protein n=1 Tax=Luteimonas endophytica TaxID=3042023 RepID=A0ABT6JE19_9GAMM|nr:nuclear transport factor 2 family protein [Luteimonas endophytica]MDH5824857.1 nuclear transport factor 2 family protein [Luteimonas endophytica]
MIKTLIGALALALPAAAAWAGPAGEPGLFETLREHDRIFFERAFNQCDFGYLERAIHPRLDFYHDQGGYQDRADFLENTRRYVCPASGPKPIRVVDEGSLQVFPLYRDGDLYGAIQSGTHRFFLREDGKADVHTSSARFTHLYLLVDGDWLLREVMSYDHSSPED